ncbi:hypothetical protein ACT2CR_00665 [Candidatus Vidania fulgoroideorum]
MYNKKILFIKKSSFVRAGGRHLRYSVYSIVGKKNKIGFGKAKSKDLALAIKKSFYNSKKNIFFITKFKKKIYKTKFKKTIVIINFFSNKFRTGGVVRKIFNMIGWNKISSKIYGSGKNYNVIYAMLNFLKNENR